ncbi:MAG: sulfatase [Candidatus Sumerlaeaceae bacterium]
MALLFACTCLYIFDPSRTAAATSQSESRYNVLFIAVDDLRPLLGCYGNTTVRSPNIDRLAASGLLFNRAYCQQAVCSPSRTSLLTGLRPDTTRVYDLTTHFRTTIPDVVTLPQLFKQNGYHTQALGKIFHGGLDDKKSWSAPTDFATTPNPDDTRYTTATKVGTAQGAEDAPGPRRRGRPWEAVDAPDNALPDGYMIDKAINLMRERKDQPFFLAIGFHKPHLPFVAPKKYFDMYSTATLPLAQNPFPPESVTSFSMTTWGELRSYQGIPKSGPLTELQARELVRGYYACVSYVDAQLGRLLEELDALKLRDKTVIVLWGDHGYHLGNHGMWTKHTNFEIATRVPLIVAAPDQKLAGAKCDALVEFVDVFPSLCELCNLAPPPGLQGRSFEPLLSEPLQKWKDAAFSQFPRGKDVMGYSMRTDKYRYTEWRSLSTSNTLATELYDELADPDENVNRAALTSGIDTTLTATLSRMLQAQLNTNR